MVVDGRPFEEDAPVARTEGPVRNAQVSRGVPLETPRRSKPETLPSKSAEYFTRENRGTDPRRLVREREPTIAR